MNVFYVGPYRQGDGWGYASKSYLECLSRTNNEIVARPIYFSNNIDNHIPDHLKQLETKFLSDTPDVLIQYCLPTYFEAHNCINIGRCVTETRNLNKNIWIDHMNILDALWVNSEAEAESLRDSGVTTKMIVIPEAIDFDELEEYKDVELVDIPELKDHYVFYIIADYGDRKNIFSAIHAFNREFDFEDQVQLVIKTSYRGRTDQQAMQQIVENVKNYKINTRLHFNKQLYLPEIITINRLTRKELLSLHQTADCLIIPSYGESFCRPALDALYYNNDIICTGKIFTESILKDNAYYVESIEQPVHTSEPPVPGIYTSWETWQEPSIIDMQKQMRLAYQNQNENVVASTTSKRDFVKNNFSFDSVGKLMEKALNEYN
tara:strand:+ start:10161 stop:11291 length:1131 start_codon:yes stop_codon:yes gene_type:complete